MLQLNFEPFPGLMTQRLKLRQLSAADTHHIFLLRSNDEVNRYLGRPPSATTAEAMEFINKITAGILARKSLYWAIQLKDDPALIGTICLWNIVEAEQRAEIGYELHPAFQGKGIMQEALESVARFGFDTMRLEVIVAQAHFDNVKSIRLLEKNNFNRNPALEKDMVAHEENQMVYTLLKASRF